MIRILLLLCLIALSGCTYMGFTDLPADEVISRYADKSSRFMQIQGVNLHYKDEGEGPTLILLHGIMASLHTWDGWAEELKADFRIIRIDIPGFGLTGPLADRKYTIERSIKLVDELASRLGLQDFHLAGNSMGGYIAWNYAAKHPAKVNKLILLDAAGYPFEPPLILQMLRTPVIKDTMQYLAPRFVITYALNEVYGDSDKVQKSTIDRYHALLLREGNREAAVDVFAYLQQMSSDKVSRVKAPTLIMWGDTDRWIPPVNAANFARDIPDSTVVMYKGVGHVPMEEIPLRSAKDARTFLKKTSGNIGLL